MVHMNTLESQLRPAANKSNLCIAKSRLRPMHPVLAIQLLAGPIVVHLLTRPLAEALIGFETPESELLDEIVGAWLRAMAPEADPTPQVRHETSAKR